MSLIRFQMLACQVEIAADNPEVIAALRYLAQDAAQDMEPQVQLHYAVTQSPDGFRILENGVVVDTQRLAHDVMYVIYGRAHQIAFAALPPHVRIHAGCAAVAGKRVLIVGEKEAGKTTLILRLIQDGVVVNGDETVLVTADGQSWPFPRRFHVRPTTFSLIPELTERQEEFPVSLLSDGGKVYGVAPTDLGREWAIVPAPIDTLFFLKKNHGGETCAQEISDEEAFRQLCSHTKFPERSVEWVALLFKLVNQTQNRVIINGSPREAAAIIRNIVDG